MDARSNTRGSANREDLAQDERAMASQPQTETEDTRQQIANLAYALWQERGRPVGTSEQDWIEAERQLLHSEKAVGAGRS